MLKRVISLILSLVMILDMMPVNLTAVAEEIPAEDLSVAETTAPTEEETVPTEAESEETVSEETVPEVTSVTGEVQTEYADTYDAGIAASGTCGENLTWTLTDDGTLTISGSGEMNNFYSSNSVPWYEYRTIIKNVIFGTNVLNIGDYAFSNCTNLNNVTIPENIKSIGFDAFFMCGQLTRITILEGTTNIGTCAFANCVNLIEVNIPESVIVIEYGAFKECNDLVSVTIPDSVVTIERAAFNSCASLENIVVPDSVTSIESSAFGGCASLQYITLSSNLTQISSYTFDYCYNLQSIEIPASVTSIEGNSFANCASLTEITFCGDAPAINETALTNVVATAYYPAGNETWTEEVRQDYGGEITWEAYETGPAVIASGTCGTNLTWTLDDEGKLTVSGEGFATWSGNAPWYDYRDSVKTVVLGDGVTGIVSNAFSRYGNLKCVQLSDTVEYIGPYAFAWCESLTDVTMGSAVTEIGEAAFRNCGSLTYITIPATVRSIGMNAFAYCEKLSGITVDEANTYYSSDENGVLFNEAKTRLLNYPGALTGTYTIPDSVTEIATCAFSACVNLTGVEIPDSVRVIESYAFDGCTGLTEIAIPASVTTLGTKTFDHCAGLQKIRFEGNAPKHFAGNKVVDLFGNTTATVYYPADDATWTEAVRQNYGGTISWKPYCLGEHTEVIDEGVDATCTTDGKTEGKHCSACGEVLVAQEVIPAGHTEVIDESVDATCTSDGKTQGKHCSACGEVLEEQEVIPASHNVENGICTKCEKYGTCGQNLTWNLDGNGVLTISGSGAMYYDSEENAPWHDSRDAVKTVIIGDEVTRIARGAFLDCSNLSEVTIGESVEEIEDIAFRNCTGLNSVEIPESVVTIGSYVFDGCTGLTKITVPDSVTRMGTGVFANCSALEEVAFEGNAPTHTYGDAVFNLFGDITVKAYYPAGNDTWTETVRQNYGGTVTWIPVCADGHTEVVDEAVKATCTADGKTEGKHCSACGMVLVKQEVIPGGHTVENGICTRCEKYGTCGQNLKWTFDSETGTLTISGTGTLENDPWLELYRNDIKTVVIGEGVTDVGSVPFVGCGNLSGIWVDENNPNYSNDEIGTLFDKNKTILLTAPRKLSSNYNIPDSVYYINSYAFFNCTDLTSITIGNSVSNIGSWAFAECSNLKIIYFTGNAPAFSALGAGVAGEEFNAVTATAYYPANNKTWTEDVMQDYGGDITWKAYEDNIAMINGVGYMTLEKALAAAQDGDVVELQKDTAEELVTVREGITLDLMGHTLTAEYFVTFNGAQTIDSSEKNTGLLKIDSNRVMISNDNTQLPVWNGEGYVFTPVKFLQAMPSCDRNGFSYVFLPRFKTGATNLLKDGVEGNKVTIEVRISWKTAQGRENRTVVYNDRYISAAITDGGALTISCGGLSKMKAEGGISIESIVVSDTGVIAASAPIVVDVSKIAPNEPLRIVKEAHALAGNTELPYNPVTLTGKIDLVNTPWNEQNQNITVTMYIADDTNREYPVTCYCMVSSGEELDECIQTLTQGDQITVKGKLMKYQDNRTGTTRVEFECPELIGYTPATNG